MQDGQVIRYGVFESVVGATVVAATPSGVCAIAFADTAEELRKELRQRFPLSKLHLDWAAMAPFANLLLQSLAGGAPLRLPLDVRGTAFQQKVWTALQTIPRGFSKTYTEVALALGLPPASARAVAGACAANPVALAIPCHRVLGVDGELRGYRWGIERKRQLLQLEQHRFQVGGSAGVAVLRLKEDI